MTRRDFRWLPIRSESIKAIGLARSGSKVAIDFGKRGEFYVYSGVDIRDLMYLLFGSSVEEPLSIGARWALERKRPGWAMFQKVTEAE